MKCENCNKEGRGMIDINNYVVRYYSWEAYNCCCKECAKERAKKDMNLQDEDIDEIEE